ncbi:hypothetical protein ACFW6N_32075 [Streptomyces cyaneofuscatus]|uniref:hypothetical protein n=1 Tax=Streptomyces cyaneofuscatus TaxID=66883 RepID=UPI003696E418
MFLRPRNATAEERRSRRLAALQAALLKHACTRAANWHALPEGRLWEAWLDADGVERTVVHTSRSQAHQPGPGPRMGRHGLLNNRRRTPELATRRQTPPR